MTLAARELAPSLLSANAQTWVNLHLLFTHGSGVVMSPVTQKSAEGLPIFYLKDIPNRCSGSQTSADSLGESLGWLVLDMSHHTDSLDRPVRERGN